MALPTFPFSPLPAALQRTINWGENVVTYDNGESQGDSPFVKPLLIWSVPVELMTEFRQSSLWNFANDRKGMTRAFLMKDAYEYVVGSVVVANSGQFANGSTTFVFDAHSYMVRPDTLFVGSLFSSLSGYVRLGVEYSLDQDTGILTVNTKANADVWSTNSGTQYFRKCRFSSQYSDTARLWNIWSAQFAIVEMP